MVIIGVFLGASAWADDLFVEGGVGLFKSANSTALMLRYQRDTSRIFAYPSYWEAVAAYWDNDTRATAVGIARGVAWNRRNRESYATTSFGLVLINRTTEHLGTRWQFYIRASYDFKHWDRRFSIGAVHFSNGKAVFGWDGPNSGENFLTLSVGLF